MRLSTSISRFRLYLRRNGFRATIRRIGLASKRSLLSNRMVLLYCDLSTLSSQARELPSSITVERKRSEADLSPRDLEQIINLWNPNLARQNLKQRFTMGALLWLIKSEGDLAGYGWTLQGRTVEPHYFDLGQADIHFFDFHVFSQYRGQGLNPLLVKQILRNLADNCAGRAFIEVAEWNQAQLSSLSKTPFRPLGVASKFTILGRTVVCRKEKPLAEPNHLLEDSPLTPQSRTSATRTI